MRRIRDNGEPLNFNYRRDKLGLSCESLERRGTSVEFLVTS